MIHNFWTNCDSFITQRVLPESGSVVTSYKMISGSFDGFELASLGFEAAAYQLHWSPLASGGLLPPENSKSTP